MNINSDVLNYAESKGLTAISTGGGCDYVDLVVSPAVETGLASPNLVMASPYGDHSPHSLTHDAHVNIFPSDEWFSFIVVPFANAKEAMDAMADPEFVAWGMHELAREIVEEDDQEEFKAAFLRFPGVDNDDPVALAKAVDKVSKRWKLADRDILYHLHTGD